MPMCVSEHVATKIRRSMIGPPPPSPRAGVREDSHLRWVRGMKLRSHVRAISTLKQGAVLSPALPLFNVLLPQGPVMTPGGLETLNIISANEPLLSNKHWLTLNYLKFILETKWIFFIETDNLFSVQLSISYVFVGEVHVHLCTYICGGQRSSSSVVP